MTQDPFLLADAIRQKENELYELRAGLARAHASNVLPTGRFTALRCQMRGVTIAIPAQHIREVVQMAALTGVPETPVWFAGMLTVGVEHMPVFDLSARQTGVAQPRDPSEFIVLAESRSSGFGACGLIVDTLEGFVVLEAAALARPGPETPFGPHVLGVASVAAEPVIVLSVAALSATDFTLEVKK